MFGIILLSKSNHPARHMRALVTLM